MVLSFSYFSHIQHRLWHFRLLRQLGMALPSHPIVANPSYDCATVLHPVVSVGNARPVPATACAKRRSGNLTEQAGPTTHPGCDLHLGHLVMHRPQRMALPASTSANTPALPYSAPRRPLSASQRRALGISYRLRSHVLANQSTTLPIPRPLNDPAVPISVSVSWPSASRRNELAEGASGQAAWHECLVCHALSFDTVDEPHTPRRPGQGE